MEHFYSGLRFGDFQAPLAFLPTKARVLSLENTDFRTLVIYKGLDIQTFI